MNPKVSIVIPVYKVEKYLRKCLDSVRAQTLTEIEIICVDDGSPDDCGRILDEYARNDNRIKVIHQVNGGLSAARNSALAMVTSPYVMFCDSDDWVDPDWCESLYAAAESSGADMVVGPVTCESTDGRPAKKMERTFRHPRTGLVALSPEVLLATDVSVWDKIFRMQMIVESGLQFKVGLKHEDEFFFWEYLAHAGRIEYVNRGRYYYCLRGDSITGAESSTGRMGLDYIRGSISVYETLRRLDVPRWFLGAFVTGFTVSARTVFSSLSEKDMETAFNLLDAMAGQCLQDRAPLDLSDKSQRVLTAIENHSPCIRTRRSRYCLGLVVKKQDIHRTVYRFAGIPIWRSRTLIDDI